MKCPVDQTELLMSDRQGIEIDYCPKCRGVWLDRGELDKLIERSAMAGEPARGAKSPPDDLRRDDYRPGHHRDDYERDRYDRDHHKRYRKRKSLLEELFDFD